MGRSSITDSTSDIGRQLTLDVLVLALTLPAIAQGTFSGIVVPFVYCVSLIFFALFFIPFRRTSYVIERYTRNLGGLRTLVITVAFINVIIPGFQSIELFGFRWIVMMVTALLAVMAIAVDARRLLS
ncbi:MAG: hypothetical protein V1907_02815 [Candidatus Kerfeldbacteria bacterium]